VTDSYPDWPFYDSGLLDELFVQLGMAGFVATLIACEG
jgi:hypothetical protein